MMVRDLTGRYAWDAYLFYESLKKMQRRVESGRAMMFDNDPARFDADPCRYRGIVSGLKLGDGVEIEEVPRKIMP